MSNEVSLDTPRDRDEPETPETTAPPLLLSDGGDDLVCVDDTCLRADVTP